MLHSRTFEFPVSAISSEPEKYIVVFSYNPGNLDKWNVYWDEPPCYPDVEVVSVFQIVSGLQGQDVYKLLSDEEETHVIDLIFEQTVSD